MHVEPGCQVLVAPAGEVEDYAGARGHRALFHRLQGEGQGVGGLERRDDALGLAQELEGIECVLVAYRGVGRSAAGLGAAAFAWIDDLIGAKPTVMIAVAAIAVFGAGALLVDSVLWFWVFAILLSTFFGPAQAASRSLMARMAPEALRTEMFGLYGLAGRVASWAGLSAVWAVTWATGSFRLGMASILVFLFAGLWLLWGVKHEREEAGAAST